MSIFQNALQGQIPAFSTSDADAQQQANAAQFMQRVAALRQSGQSGLPSPPAGRFLDQYKLTSPWDAQGGRNRMNIPQARLPEAPQLRGEDMGEGETPEQGLDAIAKVARASDQDNDPVRERLRQIDERLKAMPPLPSAEEYVKANSGAGAKYRPQIMTPLEGPDTGEVNPNAPAADVPQGYFNRLAAGIESDPRNPDKISSAGAGGKYQFMPGTWAGLMKQYPEAGLTDEGRTNSKLGQQDTAIRLYTAQSMKELLPLLGRKPTMGELYSMHLLGQGGGGALIKGQDRPVAELVGANVMKYNPWLYKFADQPGRNLIAHFDRMFS